MNRPCRIAIAAVLFASLCLLGACGQEQPATAAPAPAAPAAQPAAAAPQPPARPALQPAKTVHQPIVAGSFYPADTKELSTLIGQSLAKVALPEGPRGPLVAAITPHAGYAYSGPVAAYTFQRIKSESFARIVVVAPSHFAGFDGFAVLEDATFRTPLGEIALDQEGMAWLGRHSPEFHVNPAAWAKEHSLEVQIPWLQVVQPKAKILPIVLGRQDMAWCRTLSIFLARMVRSLPGRTLLLASADLSHYHGYNEAREMDSRLAAAVSGFDPEGLHHGCLTGDWEACGMAPMTAVMMAARSLGAFQVRQLFMANSGDATGEKERVVGYGSWAIEGAPGSPPFRGPEKMLETAPEPEGGASTRPQLSQEDLAHLLDIARRSVQAAARAEDPPDIPGGGPAVTRPAGAFVTLTKKGELRGCIGQVEAARPLNHTVLRVARLATLEDPRFRPVTPDELGELDVSLTVLGPMLPVEDPSKVEVGRHGLMIIRGERSGLLLPQVPIEQGWNRDEFLSQTCRKAGLPPDAWKQGSLLMCFEGQVYPQKGGEKVSKPAAPPATAPAPR